ncbi:hypothetical protein BOTBODRAFT_32955 [Botryobasidium botryosum FD-172 SS1]|uniref:Nucleoside transporter n=1 Tax=Botryobasidium botryosum (strain FD-172 SS1) TaxID=930990 RepID=A0A067MRE7_BOTB1|nr:hypothetical protein BOTBODRAFT_32955 [Botryobasidium botryosum FD-172 SS1]
MFTRFLNVLGRRPSSEQHSHEHYQPVSDSEADVLPVTEESPQAQTSGHERQAVALPRVEIISDKSEVPVGKLDVRVRWVHFVLGASILLPWNALITAAPYFLERLKDSPIRPSFNSYLTVTLTAVNFLFLAHATYITGKVDSSRIIRSSTLLIAFLLLWLAISPVFTLNPPLFFAFVIVNGGLQAAAGSYLQIAVVAVASQFGPSAIQAVMSGQGAAGVLISGLQYIIAAVTLSKTREGGETGVELSAFLFFGISTAFVASTLWAHGWLIKTPIYRRLMASSEGGSKEMEFVVGDDEEEGGDPEEGEVLIVPTSPVIPAPFHMREAPSKVEIVDVLWMSIKYNFAVAYVFVVTLAVFPPITTSILSVHTDKPSLFFLPVLFNDLHFLVFNVFDWLGRVVCSYPRFLIWSADRLFWLSIARTAFIPFFLLCNIRRPGDELFTPIINSDFVYLFILAAFGLSNGYVSSMCMMAAPSLENNPRLRKDQVDTAATIAQFSLVGGLAVGSVCSFAVRAAVCGCNPFIG